MLKNDCHLAGLIMWHITYTILHLTAPILKCSLCVLEEGVLSASLLLVVSNHLHEELTLQHGVIPIVASGGGRG